MKVTEDCEKSAMKMKRVSYILLSLLILFLHSHSYASGWTVFHGDAARTGSTTVSTLPPLTQVYKVSVGTLGFSSPIKTKNKIIVGTKEGKVVAYDAFDSGGVKLWEYQAGGAIDGTAGADNGVVYVSSWDGNLYALDEATGALQWKIATGSTDMSSPVVSNGVLYTGAGYPSNKLLAVNTSSKAVAWEYSATQPVYSSPAVSGASVYVGANDSVFYKADAASGAFQQKFETGGTVYLSTPVVSSDTLYAAVGDYGKKLIAVNMSAGSAVWEYTLGKNTSGADDTIVKVSSPALASGVVFVSAGFPNQKLYAVDAATGAEKWKKSLGDIGTTNNLPSPVVAGNVVFVGCPNGTLYAQDAATGADIAAMALDGPVHSTPALASGMLYVTTTTGSLYAFRIGADKDGVVPSVSFNSPSANQEVGNNVNIFATASDEHFKSVSFSYGAGSSPSSFTDVFTGYEELSNQKITTWDTTSLPEGAYTLKLRALDVLDNVKEATTTVTVSHRVPVLTLNSPADNLIINTSSVAVSGTVDGASTTVTVNGAAVSVSSGAFQTTVNLAAGENNITVIATNELGNSMTITRKVNYDSGNPVVTVSSPQDGVFVNTPSITVSGTATDVSGISSFTVSGNPVALGTGGAFTTMLTLSEGLNAITLIAADNANNSTTFTLKITLDTAAPQLTLDAPLSSGDFVTGGPAALAVSGKVSETLASLTLNSESVSVAFDLLFSKTLNLAEGKNTLTLEAVDTAGNKTTVTRTVTLDTAKVALNVTSPAQGAVTKQKSVKVSGETEAGATVKVNGNVATLDADAKFSATAELASENAKNTITVTASDGAGNETVVTRDVIHDSKPPKGTLSVTLSGAGKSKSLVMDTTVTLALEATDENGVSKMMVGTDTNFTNASWEDFAAAKTYALWNENEYGKKKVCIKFKDVADNETEALCSDEMERVKSVLAITSVSLSADGNPEPVGELGSFQLDMGQLPYAAASNGDIVIVKPDPSSLPALDGGLGDVIEVRYSGFQQSAKLLGSTLKRVPAELVMYFDDAGDDEPAYRIFVYRPEAAKWEKVPGFQEVDTAGNKVCASVQLVLNASTMYRLAKDASGESTQPKTVKALNYPNPVHGDTTFAYSLNAGIPLRVTIEVYNIRGKRVLSMEDATPDDGKYVTAEIDKLPNGVYVYIMTVTTSTETLSTRGKLVLLQ